MKASPQDVAALREAWTRSAYHESGHCFVFTLYGMPVRSVKLYYRKGFFQSTPHVEAVTDVDDRYVDTALPDHALLATLAGSAAEALWLHKRGGGNLFHLQRDAEESNTDDARYVRQHLVHSELRHAEASRAALQLVRRSWSRVSNLAEDLAGTGQDRTLRTRQVNRLLSA